MNGTLRHRVLRILVSLALAAILVLCFVASSYAAPAAAGGHPSNSAEQILYDAVNRGDWDAAFDDARPDFELVPPDQNPIAGTYRAGLSNDLTYKAVKLYFLVDRQKGGLITNFSRYTYDAVGTSKDQVAAKSGVPSGNARLASNAALGSATWDASYLKLREATLSVDVPKRMVDRLWGGARYVHLNVTGRNLKTWSKYLKVGYDPEVQQVARSLAAEMTWELWAYPPSRSYYFTIDLGF